jgi:hypothetical protein
LELGAVMNVIPWYRWAFFLGAEVFASPERERAVADERETGGRLLLLLLCSINRERTVTSDVPHAKRLVRLYHLHAVAYSTLSCSTPPSS